MVYRSGGYKLTEQNEKNRVSNAEFRRHPSDREHVEGHEAPRKEQVLRRGCDALQSAGATRVSLQALPH